MSSKLRFVVFAACALLASCGQQTPSSKEVVQTNAISMLTKPSYKDCVTDGGTAANPKKCLVELTPEINTSGRCVITAFPKEALSLTGHGHARIVWKLDQSKGNFKFCNALGDGAFLKDDPADDDDEISQIAVAANDDGDNDADADKKICRKNFKWHNKNSALSDQREYEYLLRFREKRKGIMCVFDPWVRNG